MEIAELLASAVDVDRRAAIMWRYAPQALHEWIHALRAEQRNKVSRRQRGSSGSKQHAAGVVLVLLC